MKKTIIFLIMILAFASISYAANNCYVAENCNSDDVRVLDIAKTTFLGLFDVGSHAAWANYKPDWPYRLCCPSTIGNVNYQVDNPDGAPENSNNYDNMLFSLARNDGGHVQIRDWAYYHDPDYVNPDDKEHTKYHIYAVYSDNWYNCRVAEDSDCNSDENCVFKISNPSSGHIADCSSSVSYHYKYCCQERCVGESMSCSIDSDCCSNNVDPYYYCSSGHCCKSGYYWDGIECKNHASCEPICTGPDDYPLCHYIENGLNWVCCPVQYGQVTEGDKQLVVEVD